MATTVIGLGYVGLTLSLKLASLGEQVYAVERKPEIVEMLLEGESHISEPGIEEILERYLGDRFLPSTQPPRTGYSDSHVICVNTPLDCSGMPDLSSLKDASQSLSRYISTGDLVVIRSTVPPFTTRRVVLPAIEDGSGLKCGDGFHLCVAPERTVEGNALEELGKLPQIIGGYDRASTEAGSRLFRIITDNVRPVSSMEAAEMTKLLDNSYRYAIFALANEFGLACDHLGLDAREVIDSANWEYPRNDIKLPGAGVGGGCLPKDSSILIESMREIGFGAKMLTAAKEVNEGMPMHVAATVREFHDRHRIPRERSKVLVLGLAFKGRPEVKDTRNSPGGKLSRVLVDDGFRVYGFDPAVGEEHIREFGAVPVRNVEEGFRDATCVVAMNDNPRWESLDLSALTQLQSNSSLVIDGWNVLDETSIAKRNVYFKRVGDGRGDRDS
jgi:UDP-N-acetyl-D-mannosaminuronic acid dehydrogenase